MPFPGCHTSIPGCKIVGIFEILPNSNCIKGAGERHYDRRKYGILSVGNQTKYLLKTLLFALLTESYTNN